MHADVDDDAGGAEGLAVEHAEPVAGIVEEAEVGHQPLGVERPALAVAGHPAQQPLPPVEHLAPVDRLGDLQVVAGHALVEDGRGLLPGRELLDALGHRPPHPARSGEVLARPRVVDAAVLGRRDPALQLADRARRCRSARRQRGDRAVGQLLHPLPQAVGAVDAPVAESASSAATASSTVPAGDDGRSATSALLGLDPLQLLQAPRVGLVQIHPGAEEVAARDGVRVTADGSCSSRPWCHVVGQVAREILEMTPPPQRHRCRAQRGLRPGPAPPGR